MTVRLLLFFFFCIFSLASCLTKQQKTKLVRLPEYSTFSPQPCPCPNASLCDNVQVVHNSEIFGFDGTSWRDYPLDVVTTIAWGVSDPMLVCAAHANGVRLIAGAPSPIPLSPDRSVRAKYIQQALEMVVGLHLDGITFDYEDPIAVGDPRSDYYTRLVEETTEAFHSALPGSQISVCVAWSPDDIDGRGGYDYLALSRGSDLLYVMMYDTQSQVFGRCVASANAPLSVVQRGISRYLQLGISAANLVLGVPWYGYRYPCLHGTSAQAEFCPLPLVPFRGVNCSDAAGTEIGFAQISAVVDNNSIEVLWDNSTQSVYFNTYNATEDTVYQWWFDTPDTLALKYSYAKSVGLRGVGPYTFSDLDATGETTHNPKAPAEARAMWDALAQFRFSHPDSSSTRRRTGGR